MMLTFTVVRTSSTWHHVSVHNTLLHALRVRNEQTLVPCAGNAPDKGGLALLFEMVLGGLVGTSPHMISASVMALARLLHQFANELGGKRS